MNIIQLPNGMTTEVSPEHYEELSKYNWYASQSGNKYYVRRDIWLGKGKVVRIALHRQILGLQFGDKRHGDHINRNTLDNRIENLRILSCSDNTRNSKLSSRNTSGHRGVYWEPARKKWQVRIKIEGKNRLLGRFSDFDLACSRYVEFVSSRFSVLGEMK